MKSYLTLIILFISSICYSQSMSSIENIGLEMQSFYKHPDPEIITKIIKGIDEDETFLGQQSTSFPFLGFFTVAFAKYPEKHGFYTELSEGLKYSKAIVQQSLKQSLIKDIILNWKGHDPAINDLVWGGFFASGDTRYLDRLVSELKYCERKDSLLLFLTGITAKWSLCANAKNYSLVREYLEQTLDKKTPDLQAYIKELLSTTPNEINKQISEGIREIKSRENTKSNIALCAMKDYNIDGLQIHYVLIKDKTFFDEWKKPNMPIITSVDTYRLGEDVIPIIIFATDCKDNNGNADLTYDITIRRPDGSVYGHFENLIVWKDEPAPTMHLVKQPVLIHIEKNDPTGVYKISSVVYENNKKVKAGFDLSFKVIE